MLAAIPHWLAASIYQPPTKRTNHMNDSNQTTKTTNPKKTVTVEFSTTDCPNNFQSYIEAQLTEMREDSDIGFDFAVLGTPIAGAAQKAA